MNSKNLVKKVTLLALEVIFFGSIYVVSTNDFMMPIWLMVATAIATMRMARTISENEIMETLREPFCEVKPDSCGAGNGVHPKEDNGFVRALGGLIACPICTGTWSALFLVAVYSLSPAFGKVLILVLALAGASELLYYLGEVLSWGGRLARVISGTVAPDK